MGRFLTLTVVLTLFLPALVGADVLINEVQPDPPNSHKEWVELYNNGTEGINLTGWQIADNVSSDPLDGLHIENGSFGLVLDDNLNCSNFNLSNTSCKEEEAIGRGLDNEEENLTLYGPDGEIRDSLSWESGPGHNYSIGRFPDGGGWNRSLKPTPGLSNWKNTSENSTEDGVENDSSGDDNRSKNESEKTVKNLIRILDFPETAKFGGILDVRIEVSRNETQAHTVYARIERPRDNWDASQETKIKLGDRSTGRNQNYSLVIPVLLKPNCDGRYEPGEYALLVEGLGARDEKTVEITGTEEGVCEKIIKVEERTREVIRNVCPEKVSEKENVKEYEIFSYDEEVEPGQSLETDVLLRNTLNESTKLEIYSYVYTNGTPVNEGGWTGNARDVTLEPLDREVVIMKNTIKTGTDPGNYTLKVRVKNQTDMVREIAVEGMENQENVSNRAERENTTNAETSQNVSGNNSSTSYKTEQGVTGRVFEREGPIEKVLGVFDSIFNFL